MELKNHQIIIASDVERDGIGIEIYENDKLIVEIFRSDSEQTRTIKTFKSNISLDLMEEYIAIFKKEIPWNFIDD
jgi:antitoxin component YwqK of YwqJK toxin-antitoxin module